MHTYLCDFKLLLSHCPWYEHVYYAKNGREDRQKDRQKKSSLHEIDLGFFQPSLSRGILARFFVLTSIWKVLWADRTTETNALPAWCIKHHSCSVERQTLSPPGVACKQRANRKTTECVKKYPLRFKQTKIRHVGNVRTSLSTLLYTPLRRIAFNATTFVNVRVSLAIYACSGKIRFFRLAKLHFLDLLRKIRGNLMKRSLASEA